MAGDFTGSGDTIRASGPHAVSDGGRYRYDGDSEWICRGDFCRCVGILSDNAGDEPDRTCHWFFCVSVPLLLLTLLIPGAFGGGDIKLMAACGFFLGWKLNLIALAIGIFTGGIWGIWLLATKKKERKEHFAFGPFLCVGVVCAWFLGERLLDWYWGFLVL